MTDKQVSPWWQRARILFCFVVILCAALDIASKRIVFDHFQVTIASSPDCPIPSQYWSLGIGTGVFVPQSYRPLPVIPHCLNLAITLNRGAVWGSFQKQTLFLTLVSLAAIGFIIFLLTKPMGHRPVYQILLGLIMAGAIGNLWDRLWFSGVRDFIDMYVGTFHWPTYNLADVYIVVGIVGYLLLEWRYERRKPAD